MQIQIINASNIPILHNNIILFLFIISLVTTLYLIYTKLFVDNSLELYNIVFSLMFTGLNFQLYSMLY